MAVSKKLILGVVAIVLIIAMLLMIVLPYNSLVSKEQDVKNKWSNIKVALQLKYDLLPDMLAAVNTSMGFEQGLLTNITTLRTQWLNELASNSVEGAANATSALDVQVGAFLSIYENNPNIGSIQVIEDYMTSLEGTNNRISSARVFYNDAVNDYNTAVRSFPNNLVAGSFGFGQAAYFQE
jgi:LemA protein